MSKYLHLTRITLLTLGLAALFVLILPVQGTLLASTQAAISVDTLEDEDNSDGDCSLREAIRAANHNSPVDACPGGNGVHMDTITFAVAGTITLTAQLDVSAGGPLMIIGSEAITISGGESVRMFRVGVGADLTLESLTLVDGYTESSGGGISNFGMLTITNSTLSGNRADSSGGGIFNLGQLTVKNSSFSGNSSGAGGGGGIQNTNGTLTLIDSTLSSNISEYGGGLGNGNIMTVTNSTLSDNHATVAGGAINNSGVLIIANSTLSGNDSASEGGGIMTWNSGEVTVYESALTGNSANIGGGISNGGKLTITNGTLSNNSTGDRGGGINNTGTLTLTHSTLTGNSAAWEGGGIYNHPGFGVAALNSSIIVNSPSGDNCAGDPITDAGHNIEDNDTCGFNPANGSMPNTDPLLGSLQDNGGPTWTHALLPDSPAIDAADPANCPAIDQRGVPRPLDGDGDGVDICDIGSYEFARNVLLFPSYQSGSDAPGTMLTYTITLLNETGITDTFGLTLGAHVWTTTLSTGAIGPLSSGESQPFNILVTTPIEVSLNKTDTATITATSYTSPTLYSATAHVTTQVVVPLWRLYIPIIARTE